MGERACALVNGLQLLTCKIPQGSEFNCRVNAAALDNLQVMEDTGRFEISILIYSSMDMPKAKTANIIAELAIDDDTVIYLGQLPGGEEPGYTVTRYIRHVPKQLELRVRKESWSFYPHPDEELLIGEVLSLLTDPTLFAPGGSAPHTNVHNRIKELEVYQRVVIKHYGGRWVTFLQNNQHAVYLHRDPKLEMRLACAKDVASFMSADIDFEERNHRYEKQIVEALYDTLRNGELEYRALLERLSKVDGFTNGLSPSGTMLRRFLIAHDDIFWFRKDPEHTTRVGLVDPEQQKRKKQREQAEEDDDDEEEAA